MSIYWNAYRVKYWNWSAGIKQLNETIIVAHDFREAVDKFSTKIGIIQDLLEVEWIGHALEEE